MKMNRYIKAAVALLSAVLMLISICSCATEADKPVMPIEYVKAIADYGMEVKLENLTGYENKKYIDGDFPIYCFPLQDSHFSLWACYSVEDDLMFYIMLSYDKTDEKLYLFHRDPDQILSTEQEYEGVANSYEVERFIAKVTEEDK